MIRRRSAASCADPENYAVTVFGTPGSDAPLGLARRGPHLSLNFTPSRSKPIRGHSGRSSAQPGRGPLGGAEGAAHLAREQDMATPCAGMNDGQRGA